MCDNPLIFFFGELNILRFSSIKTLKFILNHPLSSQSRCSALMRFAWWQLLCRLAPAEVLFPWIDNLKVLAKRGDVGITGNFYCGLNDYWEMAFLLHYLRSEDFFIDIGANLGSYTLLASGVIGARSLSIEPVPSTCARLSANVFVNGLAEKVDVQNIGLADKDGYLHFTTFLGAMNHVTEECEGAVKVEVKTLDGVIQQTPALIKLDTEGFEMFVLKGGTNVLSGLKAILIELDGHGGWYGVSEKEIIQTLLSYDFSPYAYAPKQRKIIPHDGSANKLFIKDLDFVQGRVEKAEEAKVYGMSV